MIDAKPDHEKLFDEICHKLSELSHKDDTKEEFKIESIQPNQQRIEKMQVQIRKFHSELQETQDEFRQKIRSLENVQINHTELNQQLKTLSDQLNHERSVNTKLNTDLAKSLEISLQLQLETQALKARAQQIQTEEKRYSQSLSDKLKATQQELELALALKEEISIEISKAKSSFQIKENEWASEKLQLEQNLQDKDLMIQKLTHEIESLSQSLNEIEQSALQQNEAMKNLMSIAENKIVEMKLAFDKKNLESQDYYSHLQQSLTQTSLLKQENAHLKDYVQKVNAFLQQQQIQNKALAPLPLNE